MRFGIYTNSITVNVYNIITVIKFHFVWPELYVSFTYTYTNIHYYLDKFNKILI